MNTPVAITCEDGGDSAALAAATLSEMGYRDVVWLKGGMDAWRSEGRSVEKGLTGVISAPLDVLPAGTNRSYGDMINYLRWETALVEQPER
jgi:3-mercaptopyruvate sulfurtransferase SseA